MSDIYNIYGDMTAAKNWKSKRYKLPKKLKAALEELKEELYKIADDLEGTPPWYEKDVSFDFQYGKKMYKITDGTFCLSDHEKLHKDWVDISETFFCLQYGFVKKFLNDRLKIKELIYHGMLD